MPIRGNIPAYVGKRDDVRALLEDIETELYRLQEFRARTGIWDDVHNEYFHRLTLDKFRVEAALKVAGRFRHG